jgi:hypothetical protein
MSVVAPKFFASTDSGNPTLSGTSGTFIEVLSSCLILRKMFTAVSGGSFVDNTTEARLEGGTPFVLFQGPTASNDEAYFGLTRPFESVKFTFAAVGVQNAAVTLVWEYWNGSAWTALTVTSDTTSELTQHYVGQLADGLLGSSALHCRQLDHESNGGLLHDHRLARGIQRGQ